MRSCIAGLQLLDRGESVDVILTDVVMPGMSGLDLGQRVKQRSQKPHTQETLSRTIREVLDT